ncbi:MAG: ribonuclease P protein component [Paludibacter sp.]|jgi:ribonuclease P protein component|nr:ribonuclease P protein component [Paludibacter sp.]
MFTFNKSEHLCGETKINRLFAKGKAFIVYPVRVVYLVENENIPAIKVLVSVPKKKFKHAVSRNRLKRLMREAYRLNKSALTERCAEKMLSLQIAFCYIDGEMADFEVINKKIQIALAKIEELL